MIFLKDFCKFSAKSRTLTCSHLIVCDSEELTSEIDDRATDLRVVNISAPASLFEMLLSSTKLTNISIVNSRLCNEEASISTSLKLKTSSLTFHESPLVLMWFLGDITGSPIDASVHDFHIEHNDNVEIENLCRVLSFSRLNSINIVNNVFKGTLPSSCFSLSDSLVDP